MEGLRLIDMLKLTALEQKILEEIQKYDQVTVLEISRAVRRPRESVSRSVNSLRDKGLVEFLSGRPRKIYTVPYGVVAQELVTKISSSLDDEKGVDSIHLPFMFIHNREAHHQLGMKLFNESENEVLSIVSGRGDLHPDFYKVMIEKIQKGVQYKLIILHYDEINKKMIENWKKNGFEVRFLPGEEINIEVYDRKIVQFGVRMLAGSREKVGMVIRNASLGKFMGEFFDNLWKKGEVV